uniref:BCLAF1 and THRAP3 family member 3 n=1 Tax=Xiphophorus maculatus TaxID=8083 RepID=M4A703_XIPMA
MLEHSGTYRENAAHTGTFAQEIITLVHFVKEHYFRGDGVTLTERFSAPQKGGYAEDELEELTLHQRFSSNSKQPQRGPGDLRHDLERRRQEKLEAVKVTIEGSSFSQRSQHSQWSEQSVPVVEKRTGEPGATRVLEHPGPTEHLPRSGRKNSDIECFPLMQRGLPPPDHTAAIFGLQPRCGVSTPCSGDCLSTADLHPCSSPLAHEWLSVTEGVSWSRLSVCVLACVNDVSAGLPAC